MAGSTRLIRARVVLEAVRLATDADISPLRQLIAQHTETLKLDLVFRILLTFLPESTELELYSGLLADLSTGHLYQTKAASSQPPATAGQDLSEEETLRRVRRLHLLPSVDSSSSYLHDVADSFTLFLLHRAHKIDAETGSLPLVSQLLAPFIDHSEILRTWVISTLCPILRLDYDYYPNHGPAYSLEAFEKLDGVSAINLMLTHAAQWQNKEQNSEIARDLRGLVGPWMYGENARKRRKLVDGRQRNSSATPSNYEALSEPEIAEDTTSGWNHVNNWLLELAVRDFPRVVHAIRQWSGPGDIDYGDWGDGIHRSEEAELRDLTRLYTQAGLAAVYATSSFSFEALEGSHYILLRIAQLMDLPSPPGLDSADAAKANEMSHGYMATLSPAHLLQSALLRPLNPFTLPNQASMSLAYLLLASAFILDKFGHPKSCKSVAELSIFGNEAEQLAELRKTLHKLPTRAKDEEAWKLVRNKMLWLRGWSWQAADEHSEKPVGVFSKVGKEEMEIELLKAFLNATLYDLAIEIYCKQDAKPLPKGILEKTVLSTAMSFYDGASNGNRNRGGVRKASEITFAFSKYFPQSRPFQQINALLVATHAMSFYSLTIQNGVPIQPVHIRAHQDPMSLIGRILDQNPRSYTKLDDLLQIGQSLVVAGLGRFAQEPYLDASVGADMEQETLNAKRRIMGMAIDAALAEEDFDTAYSYVINRLSPSNDFTSRTPDTSSRLLNFDDDYSWRAACQAGRYRPKVAAGPITLRRLEQRMELLSQALLLAPISALSEILIVWRRCEDEMSVLIAQEAEEVEMWDDKGDRKVPGGFAGENSPIVQKSREPSRNAMNEEAPMGLFDVARGAAAALSKTAFPLRTTQADRSAASLETSHKRPLSTASAGGSDNDSLSGVDSEGRVRKRDMVSNMVTGGLASGIGWVLGAPSVRPE